MLDMNELLSHWIKACEDGTFVTPKHDPANLDTPDKRHRSVNCMGNDEMTAFLRKREFTVDCYANKNSSHSPELYTITPRDAAVVPGSGVRPLETTGSTAHDIFAVPSGFKQGWHAYSYDSTSVSRRVTEGHLHLLGEVPNPPLPK